MALSDRVHIARRFQRAIRIDTDLADPTALEGFICPPSSADILKIMARHVAENGQGAFTWTGPYGSGKSSLAVAFSSLLNRDADLRYYAASVLGESTADSVWDALPLRTRGWRVLPVVGRRDRPAQVVGEAIEATGLLTGEAPKSWSEQLALERLQNLAAQYPRAGGGLLIFIDEMGKFLEAAVHDGTDIYFFQQLAELASRSNKRLIVVGILHQAFEGYAHRLAREMRDEWAKIQGRFVDLAVNISGDEQIDLLGRAIESDREPEKPSALAEGVATLHRQTSLHLAQMLERLLAASSHSGLSARTSFAAPIRPEPAQHLWVSQLHRAAGLPRFSAICKRRRPLCARPSVGLSAHQSRTFHPGLT